MPHARNPHFTGREAALAAIHAALQQSGAAGITPILQRSAVSEAFSERPLATSTRRLGEAWLPAYPATGT